MGGIKARGQVLSLRFIGIAHVQFTASMSDIFKTGFLHHQCSGGFCTLPAPPGEGQGRVPGLSAAPAPLAGRQLGLGPPGPVLVLAVQQLLVHLPGDLPADLDPAVGLGIDCSKLFARNLLLEIDCWKLTAGK